MSAKDYKYRLPEVLEAHRQTANWLVGLSTGALAGLATFLEWPRGHSSPEEWTYGLAALFFIMAVCSGVLFHLCITNYTNAYEQHARAEEQRTTDEALFLEARTANDAAKLATIEERIKKCGEDMKDFDANKQTWHRWFKRFYRALVFFFFASVVLGCSHVTLIARHQKSAASQGDVLLLDGRHQTETNTGYSALLLDTQTGKVFELHNDASTGGTRWVLAHAYARKVCADSVQVVTTQQSPVEKENTVEADSTHANADGNTDERTDGTN